MKPISEITALPPHWDYIEVTEKVNEIGEDKFDANSEEFKEFASSHLFTVLRVSVGGVEAKKFLLIKTDTFNKK